MRTYDLTHVGDRVLLSDLKALAAKDRNTTAELLAHIAEVDARRLFAPAGHSSMFVYCVRDLRLSEDEAYKRIQAARAARRFPAIYDMVAEGRLHLTAIRMLAPHLAPENAGELLDAATHRTKAEIETLLAERFPSPDVPSRLRALPTPRGQAQGSAQLVPGPVGASAIPSDPAATPGASASAGELVPGPVANAAVESDSAPNSTVAPPAQPAQSAAPHAQPASRNKITPIAPRRYALHCTIDQGLRDKLRYARELMSHRIPSGDLEQILGAALDALIPQLEKQRFAATREPRKTLRSKSANRRHIPARVKRAVWKRDSGRCTFVGENGHRCEARTMLEYDHVQPVARGGEATLPGIRLRCRAHNQLEAERVLGSEFMNAKRDASLRARGHRATASSGARTGPGTSYASGMPNTRNRATPPSG